MEPYVLYKHGFKRSVLPYFTKYAFFLVVTLAAGLVTSLICNLIFVNATIFAIAGRLLFCLIIPNLIFYFIFRRTKEFSMLRDTVMGVIRRKTGKKL